MKKPRKRSKPYAKPSKKTPAQKARDTRRAREREAERLRKKRSEAAKRAAVTRRKNKAEAERLRKRRSRAAKKGAKTRREKRAADFPFGANAPGGRPELDGIRHVAAGSEAFQELIELRIENARLGRALERAEDLKTVRLVIELKAMHGLEADDSYRPSRYELQWLADVTGKDIRELAYLCVSPSFLEGYGAAA